jgi:hypothetical protein
MGRQSALKLSPLADETPEQERYSEPARFRAGRRPSKSTPSHEALARQELEALRETPYSDEEWVNAKSRLLALARLVRRWVKAA